MGENSFDRVSCYSKFHKHADCVSSAKQRPEKLQRSDDV